MARLVFLENYKMARGDIEELYSAGLCYEVPDPSLVPFGIAYPDGEEPPFDALTRQRMAERDAKEARLRRIIQRRQRAKYFVKQELAEKQAEKLQQALEARRTEEGDSDA